MAEFIDALPPIAFPTELDTLDILCDNGDPLPFGVRINGTLVLNTTLYPDAEDIVCVTDFAEFLMENLPAERVSQVAIYLDDHSEGVSVVPSRCEIGSAADTFCAKHFLTLLKGSKPTYFGAVEYLSYYNPNYTNAPETPVISCLWVNPDTAEVRTTAENVPMTTHYGGGLFTLRILPGSFTCPAEGFILHSFTVSVGQREQDYTIFTPTDCEPLSSMFTNNFGVRETFHCFGTYEKELKPNRSTASFSGRTRNYKVEAVPTWKCETGILSESVQPLFADLCAATQVWRQDNNAEVTITENEHKISNDRYEPQMGSITFRESGRTAHHKPIEHVATFDRTFDETFD